MCGICGIFNYANTHPQIEETILMNMRDAMLHRGPDDIGLYLNPDRRLGFGFRRLSIIDLSAAGHQPMCNEDGTVWIVYNGETYNFRALRREMEAKGHQFRSQTDTEVLVHLYEEYGPEMVQHLNGMFAFAVWDENKQRLFLARDRIGIKPLYYTVQNGQLIFASEIKAILQHPAVSKNLNPEALYHYLTFLTTPTPHTMFAGIHKLAAGHYAVINSRGDMTQQRYWHVLDAMQPEITPQPEEFYIENIRHLLRQSIKDRMVSDVPFGVFLSGGVDSSLNVALMDELMDRPVETFSIGFTWGEKFDEFQYAEQVAKRFKTNHHTIRITEQDFFDFLPQLPFYQDEPLADPVCVPLYYVSKLARDNGVIVIQVGEGSDELFFGYRGYRRAIKLFNLWRNRVDRLVPRPVQKLGYPLARPFLGPKAQDYLRRCVHNEEIFWGNAISSLEIEKNLLLSAAFKKQIAALNSHQVVRERYNQIEQWGNHAGTAGYARKMSYLEIHNRLPELLLMRVDKMAMANSIETRVPFLDHRLVEFAMNIPFNFKLRGDEGKYILKKAVEGIIPHDIIYRKKQGFGGSIINMFTPGLHKFTADTLLSTPQLADYFDMKFINHMVAHPQKFDVQLWTLLNFAMWYKQWMV